MLIFVAPLVGHIATTNYAVAYAAYRAELVGAGIAEQVVGHFGIALLALCAAGLGGLIMRKDTRGLGILITLQAVLAFTLFTRVQTLLGVHHYYLLVPAAGIGIAGAIASLWNVQWRPHWRAAGIIAVLSVVLSSSAAVFAPSPWSGAPLLPRGALCAIGEIRSGRDAAPVVRLGQAKARPCLRRRQFAVVEWQYPRHRLPGQPAGPLSAYRSQPGYRHA